MSDRVERDYIKEEREAWDAVDAILRPGRFCRRLCILWRKVFGAPKHLIGLTIKPRGDHER